MRSLLLLALFSVGVTGGGNDYTKASYSSQGIGWSDWSTISSTSVCATATVTTTIEKPTTLPGPPAQTITVTAQGPSGCCGGGTTTIVNNFYETKTTTITSTRTETITTTVPATPCPTSSSSGCNIDVLLAALTLYFNTSFIQELNETLFASLNASLSVSLNESLSLSLNETIFNSMDAVIGVEIDNSIHNAIHDEFTSVTFLQFEQNLTQSIDDSINGSIAILIDNSVHTAFQGEFLTGYFLDFEANITNSIDTTVDKSIRDTFTGNFLTSFEENITTAITRSFNDTFLTNVNETIYGALRNTTYNTNITLNESSLRYMNKSITDVLFGYIHEQFTDQSSIFYSDLSTITLSTNGSPWYAIAILVLLLIFGVLTLACLLWLILRKHKHKKQMGTCPECGAPQDRCACGT